MKNLYYREHLIKLFRKLFLNSSNGKNKLIFYETDISLLNASTQNQPHYTKEKLREINFTIKKNDKIWETNLW